MTARTSGTLFVDRTNPRDLFRMIREVEEVLERGQGVAVFPEGTSSEGARVLPFMPSVFEVAVRTSCPVTTASLSYTTPEDSPPAQSAVCWWGDMTFFDHLFKLLALPRFEVRLVFGDESILESDRKELATRTHRAVPLPTHGSSRGKLPLSPGADRIRGRPTALVAFPMACLGERRGKFTGPSLTSAWCANTEGELVS